MLKRQRFTFATLVVFVWVMMILLGSIVLETFMVYPNIFHDPPRTLDLAKEFMSVSGPSSFFPPLGFVSWVTGALSLILVWRVRPVRGWIGLALAMMILEGVFSMALFWPRNTIMFIEGTRVHSAEVLRQTAFEFERLHWARLLFNAVGSASAFTGFVKFHRKIVETMVR